MADLTSKNIGIEGEASRRKLFFYWLVDWSGSMYGEKIQRVNWAIKEVIPELQRIEDTERVSIYVSAIKIGDKAEWHIGPDPIPVSQFKWEPLRADGGLTSTAGAINLLSDALDVDKLGSRCVPPVCILLSDGNSTEGAVKYKEAIDRINSLPWGKKAVRLSIGIEGRSCSYDKDELDQFISPYLRSEGKVETLHADSPRKLVDFIRIASVVASVSASRSNTNTDDNTGTMPVRITDEDLNQDIDDDDAPDFSNVNAADEF